MTDFISIDWDFFTLNRELDGEIPNDDGTANIPGLFVYDWQMAENRAPAFEGAIWEIRATGLKRMGFDPENATRVMVPVETFVSELSVRWENLTEGTVYTADSHAWMGPLVRQHAEEIVGEPLTVFNFDAHHDLSYNDNPDLACDNWALVGLRDGWISNLVQVYPDFRGKKEWTAAARKRTKNFKSRIEILTWTEFLAHGYQDRETEGVFTCRSSSWTPPWRDNDFQALVDELGFAHCLDCSHPKYARYDSCEPREWNWQAIEERMQMLKELETLNSPTKG